MTNKDTRRQLLIRLVLLLCLSAGLIGTVYYVLPNEITLLDFVPEFKIASEQGYVVESSVAGTEGNAAYAFVKTTSGECFHSLPNDFQGNMTLIMPEPKLISRVTFFPQVGATVFYERLPAAMNVSVTEDGVTWKSVKDVRDDGKKDGVDEDRPLIVDLQLERPVTGIRFSFEATRGDVYLTFSRVTFDELQSFKESKERVLLFLTIIAIFAILLVLRKTSDSTSKSLLLSLPMALVVWFPFLMLSLVCIGIFLANSTEFILNLSGLLFVLIVLGWSAYFFGFLVRYLRGKSTRVSYALPFLTGIIIWFECNVIVWNWGLLDGTPMPWDRLARLVTIDCLVLCGLYGIYLLLEKYLKAYLPAICALMLAMQASDVIWQGLGSSVFKGRPIVRTGEDLLPIFSSEKQNVVFILLDMFQGDILQDLLLKEDLKLSERLGGFTYFRNTLASYPVTLGSVPSMLTGRVFRNETTHDKYLRSAFTEMSLPKYFSEKDFDLSIINLIPSELYLAPEMVQKGRLDRVPKTRLVKDFAKLVDLTLFRSAPYLVKPMVLSGNRWFFTDYQKNIRTIFDKTKPVSRLNNTKRRDYELVADMESRFAQFNGRGTFKFIHLYTPHLPVDTDENGEEMLNAEQTRQNYSRQAQGAMELALRIVKLMETHGVLDNSIVVIAGDHGYGFPITPFNQTEKQTVTNWMSRAVPLLLVKDYGADRSKALVLSDAPVSLKDIPNTLTAQSFGESPFAESKSLFLHKPEDGPDDGQCRYFLDSGTGVMSYGRFKQLTEYCVRGHVWNFSSYQPTGKVFPQ